MADTPTSVVIVGAGLAGAKTAEALRDAGYAGPVTLLGAEDELPVRAAAAVQGLPGRQGRLRRAIVHPETWYAEHDVELRRGTDVVAVDPGTHEVELADGSRLPYGALVLATGSEPRRLPIPGADAALTLRTRADSDAIRSTFGAGKRLVIVGGGWIGLEVAAAARDKDTEVTLLESRRAAAARASWAARWPPCSPTCIASTASTCASGCTSNRSTRTGSGWPTAPRSRPTQSCSASACDRAPNSPSSAALDVDNGVLVDASLRTSDPDVFAVGDIANHDHPVLGQRVRVEHWATALNQPKAAVAALLGGSRRLRPTAVLLQRPVRPRHGVRRLRRARRLRAGRGARRPRRAGVRGVLARR